MTRVEQIFCTHCPTEKAVFGHGYTARAASQPAATLQETYSKVFEPLLHGGEYLPPLDTDESVRRSATAHQLPVRLAYRPRHSGYVLLGQSCYRTEDSSKSKRIGSYFAHFLYSDQPDPWPTVDCLRLWNAPLWQAEDSPQQGTRLSAWDSFDELLGQQQSHTISERLLEGFLRATTADQFAQCDPGHVIPSYCRRASPEARQQLVARLLRGYLELNRNLDESLLLVADPALAAILFFAILRLIPPTVHGPDTGFSTFETDLSNPAYTLVATTFYAPFSNGLRDLVPQLSPRFVFIANLFQDQPSKFRHQRTKYPSLIVSAVAREGWLGAQYLLNRIERMEPQGADDLEFWASLNRRVHCIFPPHLEDTELPTRSDSERRYAALVVRDLLVDRPRIPPDQLARAPRCLEVLDLLFSEVGQPTAAEAARPIIQYLDVASLELLLQKPHFEPPFRLDLLRAYLRQQGPLRQQWLQPPDEKASQDSMDHRIHRLLSELLAGMSHEQLVDLHAAQAPDSRTALLKLMANVHQANCRHALWRILIGSLPLDKASREQKTIRARFTELVDENLVDNPPDDESLAQLARTPNVMLLLSLLLHKIDSRRRRTLVKIASGWPLQQTAQLVNRGRVPEVVRAELLQLCIEQCVASEDPFPEGLQSILAASACKRLLARIVSALPAETSLRLYVKAGSLLHDEAKKNRDAIRRNLLDALLETARDSLISQEAIAGVAETWSDKAFDNWLSVYCKSLVPYCPEKHLQAARQRYLRSLPQVDQADQFRTRVTLLQHLSGVPGGDADRKLAERWFRLVKNIERCNSREGQSNQGAWRPVVSVFRDVAGEYDLPAAHQSMLLARVLKAYEIPSDVRDDIQQLYIVEPLMRAVDDLRFKVKESPATTGSNFPALRFSWPEDFHRDIQVMFKLKKKGLGEHSHEVPVDQDSPIKRFFFDRFSVFRRTYNEPLEMMVELRSPHWSFPILSPWRETDMSVVDTNSASFYDVLIVDHKGRDQNDRSFLEGLLRQTE